MRVVMYGWGYSETREVVTLDTYLSLTNYMISTSLFWQP